MPPPPALPSLSAVSAPIPISGSGGQAEAASPSPTAVAATVAQVAGGGQFFFPSSLPLETVATAVSRAAQFSQQQQPPPRYAVSLDPSFD